MRFLAALVLLILVTRTIVYALASSPAGLDGHLGGPGFVSVLVVALSLGAVLSVAAVWLASMGVRERWALADGRGELPRIAAVPLLVRAGALAVGGWVGFAAVETSVHWRAGMGFHGLQCLVGPVHVNALPVAGGLALLVSALWSVAVLVLAWMRRTVGRLVVVRAPARPHTSALRLLVSVAPRRAPLLPGAPARGPPTVAA